MLTSIKQISDTVRAMNWAFGYGELMGDVQFAGNGEAVAIISRPHASPVERKVTVLDNGLRVRFAGRIRKVY